MHDGPPLLDLIGLERAARDRWRAWRAANSHAIIIDDDLPASAAADAFRCLSRIRWIAMAPTAHGSNVLAGGMVIASCVHQPCSHGCSAACCVCCASADWS